MVNRNTKIRAKYLLLLLLLPLTACQYVNDHYLKPMVSIPVVSGDTLSGRIVERTDTTITLYNKNGFGKSVGKHMEISNRSILVEEIEGYHEEMAVITINDRDGLIDTNGCIVVDPIYDDARACVNGMTVVELKGKFGCIDKQGRFVIQPIYRRMFNYQEGIVICVTDNGWIEYRDSAGKFQFMKLGRIVRMFSEGLAYVEEYKVEGGLFGRKYYINKKGEIELLLDDLIENAGDFHEGLARADLGGFSGFIDRKGRWIIFPQYEGASSFHDGLAKVYLKDEGKIGIINKNN